MNNLDDRFQEAKQQFYYTLLGRERSPPRWKYCVTQTNTNMGMALGAMFVRKYFDENSKNDVIFYCYFTIISVIFFSHFKRDNFE